MPRVGRVHAAAMHAQRQGRVRVCAPEGTDSATGRKLKMPPPPLFTSTTVSGAPCGCARTSIRPLVSCRNERSPMTSVAGPRNPAANPAAAESTPSMPEAPRLAATGFGSGAPASSTSSGGASTGLALGVVNISRSRIGIELPAKRPWPRGRYAAIVAATAGSVTSEDPAAAPPRTLDRSAAHTAASSSPSSVRYALVCCASAATGGNTVHSWLGVHWMSAATVCRSSWRSGAGAT